MNRTRRWYFRVDDNSTRRTGQIILNFHPAIVLQIIFEAWDPYDDWNVFTTRLQASRHELCTKTYTIVPMIFRVFNCCRRIVDILDMLLSNFCVVLVLLKYWSMLICRLIALNRLLLRLTIQQVLLYG